MKRKRAVFSLVVAGLCAIALLAPTSVMAGDGHWWDVVPEEENPSPFYDSILYSEIAPKLREIEVNSNRVKVEVIGQSAGGRDMFLVTLSAPESMGRLGQYQAISQTMLKDPEKAQEMIDKFGDFKVPVFINGSIHGGEYPGTDAAIRLIETLAYEDTPEVQAILENVILLVNVVQNPDGRVMGTRSNANGFDINRDFISQTQPESRATVEIFTEWNPMVVLDLHGFVNPMLIEPTTPPHNPNYEYDLYLQWALDEAYAMEDELFAQLGLPALIPYRDWADGWDDWGAQYVPMYAMYHGAYGHTLETPSRTEVGVDAHYAAVWGALEFVAENREAMIHDQIEIFRRGFLDLPQMLIPDELLDETQWDQFNEMTVQEFPAAYVIPAGLPFQQSSHQAARLVDFLLFNDVEVEQASQPFTLDGTRYPKGTYVVWMDQPKRGLANTILDAGPDLSDIVGLTFYSPPAVWSHPLLWGAFRAVAEEELAVNTTPVNNADKPSASVSGKRAGAYAYEPTSIAAFQVTNELIDRGVAVQRASSAFEDDGMSFEPGTFIVSADRSLANELANQHALNVFAISGAPTDAVVMEKQSIAVYADEGTVHALEVLGFDYDVVGRSDVNDGVVEGYDLFLNRNRSWGGLNDDGRASLSAFFAAGGDYVGLRSTGIEMAEDAGIIDVDFDDEDGNAIVEVVYSVTDGVAGGFLDEDYAFVYTPAWFTRLGAGVVSSAEFSDGDFLISGFWPGWGISGAAGSPVVVHGSNGDSDTTLIGLDVTFRGHPENTFRILGNAIYNGLD
ncbi:MAG: M14 family zinc carboxypeptidase [Acidimicrobiia bacterium]|nr:M14 family zinc carboxypeptidase [Acidimicrobiia bacterium]